jgi:DNA-3-methyladenine glycosylase I
MDPEQHRGPLRGSDGRPRCLWCAGSVLYERDHDGEWGAPVDDDQRLSATLCPEGFQATLSWWTLLRKGDPFRRALAQFDFAQFDFAQFALPHFDFVQVARLGAAEVARLRVDAGIVRHRGEI